MIAALLAACGGEGSSGTVDAGAADGSMDPDSGVQPDGGIPPVPGADPTFGNGGLVTANFGGGLSGLMAIARQADGKLVALGGSRESIAVMRIHSDGSSDTTFGVDGVVQLPWGVPTNGIDKSHAIAIQPDGKIVFVTRILGTYGAIATHGIVVRLHADGSLDTSFAGTGYVLSEMHRDLRALALQSDGKIVVGGIGRLERFLADGTRDTTFGTNGVANIAVSVQDIALQIDGAIVTAGGQDVARFTAIGAPDTTFGGGTGKVSLPNGNDTVYSVAVAADGKILVGGGIVFAGATSPRFAIVRYAATGALDTTFGTNGIAHDNNTMGGSQALGIGIAPDGKIVGIGFANVNGTVAGRSARFDTNGALDTTYGGAGAGALLNMLAFADPVFDADGAVISAGAWLGTGSFRAVIGRTTTTGQPDPTFGTGGTIGREIGGSFDRVHHIVVQPDGKVIASGRSADVGSVVMTRLGSDGARDSTFGTDGLVTRVRNSDIAYVNTALVQPTGKIVITGPTYRDGFSLVRLDANGAPDMTFGTEGVVRAVPVAGMNAVSRALAAGADGSLFIAGETATSTGSAYAVVRFSADGVRDTNYGGTGAALASIPGPNIATHLAVQPDGKAVVLGVANGSCDLVRFDAAGAVDASFGTAGRATAGAPPQAREPFGLLLQPDGKIVAVTANFSTGAIVVTRFNSDGTADNAFGTSGVANVQLAGGNDYFSLQAPMGVALLADGRLVIGGAAATGDHLVQSAVLVRLNADGSPDDTLAPGGVQTFDLGRGSSAFHAAAVQPDGKLLVGGRVWTESGGSDFAVMRLVP